MDWALLALTAALVITTVIYAVYTARIPAEAAQGTYQKLRLAYLPHWNAYYNSAMARYEDMIEAQG